MTFAYEPELLEYMREKGMTTIAVEVMSSDHSDFEVTELYVHLIRDRQVEYFIQNKGFHPKQTEHGLVLLPNYRLAYDDTVTFGLKKFWVFRSLKQTGIRL